MDGTCMYMYMYMYVLTKTFLVVKTLNWSNGWRMQWNVPSPLFLHFLNISFALVAWSLPSVVAAWNFGWLGFNSSMTRCLSLCGIFSGNTIGTFVTYSGWSSSKSLQRLRCPMLAYGSKHSKASSWSGLPRLVRTDDLPSIMAIAISVSGKRESSDIGLMCDQAWYWLRSMTDFRMDLELYLLP